MNKSKKRKTVAAAGQSASDGTASELGITHLLTHSLTYLLPLLFLKAPLLVIQILVAAHIT